jgi:co-chaperonin GroES (HSP10)
MKLNDNKEIKPLFNYVIVRIIDINPYVIRKTESGILLGNGSVSLSQETGQLEKLEQVIQFAVVVEAGDECKTLIVGDEVYFDIRGARPLPILDLGYLYLNEQNIMTYIRGEGDSIAEAKEFEDLLREELKQNKETQKQEATVKKLEGKGVTVKKY